MEFIILLLFGFVFIFPAITIGICSEKEYREERNRLYRMHLGRDYDEDKD